MTFTAKYRSPCELCDDKIMPGQEAEYGTDGHVQHAICPEDRDYSGTPLQVCPRCFMAIPVSGECGVCDD